MRWHLDIRHQGAIDTKPDAGFELAGHGLNMNVRHLLVIGVDNDLVDELDEFIVRRSRLQRVVIAAIVYRATIHVGQQLVDRAAFSSGPK